MTRVRAVLFTMLGVVALLTAVTVSTRPASGAKPPKPTTSTIATTTTSAAPSTTTTTVPGQPAAGDLERNGPHAFASTTVADASTPGFGAATIYYPTATGTFGGIAISPGFTESQSAISWLGPRLSSHGFVVITFNTNSGFDNPSQRAAQLLAALDYLTGSSSVRGKVDAARTAVMGHSMGGGGAIEATNSRPALKASVPLTPWDGTKNWPGARTPTLVIGAQSDDIAPVASHAIPLYEGLTGVADKAYLELANAEHSVTNSNNALVSRFSVAWMKRFLDNNTAYEQFLCPPPATGGSTGISQYRSTCPY
jgi:alpha-beta hydrolase superfamily lysophospholipase